MGAAAAAAGLLGRWAAGQFATKLPAGQFAPQLPGGQFAPQLPGGQFSSKLPAGQFAPDYNAVQCSAVHCNYSTRGPTVQGVNCPPGSLLPSVQSPPARSKQYGMLL